MDAHTPCLCLRLEDIWTGLPGWHFPPEAFRGNFMFDLAVKQHSGEREVSPVSLGMRCFVWFDPFVHLSGTRSGHPGQSGTFRR